MSKIYKGVSELIGKTPIIEAVNFEKAVEADATILAKLEYFNPAGSVKDRVALAMIEEAEKKGVLKKGALSPANCWISIVRSFPRILVSSPTVSCPFRYIFATSSESFPIFATSSKCVITLTPSSVSGKP